MPLPSFDERKEDDNMKYDLNKLSPKETVIRFVKIDHDFTVKKITLRDDAWMMNEFGGREGVSNIFMKSDIRSLVRIFYRLLSEDDKRYLTGIVFELTDEDGKAENVKSNIDKLLYLIESTETKPLIEALLASRGASLPEIEKIISDAEKETIDEEKKSLNLK